MNRISKSEHLLLITLTAFIGALVIGCQTTLLASSSVFQTTLFALMLFIGVLIYKVARQ